MSAAEAGGRVALVTGAARGIGAATVARLCAEGYRVTAFDSAGTATIEELDYTLATAADLDRLADRLGDAVLPFAGDVRSPEDLRAAVRATTNGFGRLDVVVAGAGIIAGGAPVWQTPAAQLDALMQVNAIGVWNTAAATIPVLLDQPDPSGGRFIAIASAAGDRGLFHLGGYVASKHAVVGIVRGLAADLAGTGVTAVAVSPGSTDTVMLAATARLYRTSVEDLADQQALRRLITPDEMAQAIAWCAAPAGAILNGSIVHADGGFGR